MFEYGDAICYSGYRDGQSPHEQSYPTHAQVKQDLQLLAKDWRYLRMYDSGPHVATTLRVIREEGFDFKLMFGVDLAAEVSNPNCPWGGEYADEVLGRNRAANLRQIEQATGLANAYQDIVFAVSIGNEASVEWTDHLVSVDSLVDYAGRLKQSVRQPVTFCENYVPWLGKLDRLVEVVDFISVHTYPVWEYKTIDQAMGCTMDNYYAVKHRHPNKIVIISEAGWTTGSNGRGIDPWNATEDLQAIYCQQLRNWARNEGILTFLFEAFDEPWKGSDDPMEPEKHWGLYYVEREPKKVVQVLAG